MIWNYNLKKTFKIKFAYVNANDAFEMSYKNRLYHYTTPCEMVVFDSDGMTGSCILHG
jgi:hypothetical protein